MSNDNTKDDNGSKLSLTVTLNKEKNKVLHGVADNHLVDILLSFLTLPLGRIVKLLEKHYGDEAPAIGSLSSLYRSIANLDASYFLTEGAKHALLNPASLFEDEYKRLKLDISDEADCCPGYRSPMSKEVKKKSDQATSSSSDGVFTKHGSSFIISDDLHILPHHPGLIEIGSFLGIMDTDEDEPGAVKLNLGLSEIMSLLKSSMTSPTPLSDTILNKTTKLEFSAFTEHQVLEMFNQMEIQEDSKKKISLKVLVCPFTGTVLYAKANEDFIELLLSFLFIPLGGVNIRLAGKTGIRAIDSFYQSTAHLIDEKFFKSPDTKNRLMKPNLVHGCVSLDHILRLTEESLPGDDSEYRFPSVKFPKGQGRYLKGPQTYVVKDDLTVEPFCIISIVSSLDYEKQIFGNAISDAKEVELQIGVKEALSILNASLTSNTALTHALQTLKYKESFHWGYSDCTHPCCHS